MRTSIITAFFLCAAAFPQTSIERQFASPPAQARVATYFWSFGPAWTRPEIDRHLTLFEKAGIGRLLIYPLYPCEVDDPARGIRNLNYLSPEFLDMLSYLVGTAKKRGLECDLVMGTGWPYGGPMIPETLSPKRIVMKAEPVRGAAGVPASMRLPPLAEHEEIIAAQLVPDAPGRPAIDVRVENGEARFTAPEGGWSLMTFLQSPTTHRHKVIYAAAGGGGNVIDHLDERAVQMYLKEVSAKLAEAVKGNLRAFYCPSMEVDGTSWTPRYLEEFARRRGYDLKPHLSALFRDEGDKSLHIRRDYWETIQELGIDKYLRPAGDWIRSQGIKFQAESYGTPPVRLNSFAAVDYPQGEDLDWKQFNRTRWASSGAHFYRQPVVSVEAYTWIHPVRYAETLQDLKIGSDLHFVSGANRMVMHGYGFSPRSVPSPGWGYFAGVMATEHSPWWPYFPQLSSYLHRVGYILGEGVPVSDVALYLPEDDVFADSPPGYVNFIHVKYRLDRVKRRMGDNFGLPNAMTHETDVVKTIITNGYSLDGIDHSILPTMGKVAGGRLEVGHASFPILVLPGLRGMPLEDLEKAAEFCRGGGTLIATLTLPRMPYGYRNAERNMERFRALAEELFGGIDTTRDVAEKRVGKGRAIFARDEKAALVKALNAVPPDVVFDPSTDETGFVHRRAENQDFYFVANFSPRERSYRAGFRVGRRKPRIWDPMTGKIRDANFEYRDQRTVVDLTLDPWGSTIVEFGSSAPPPKPAANPKEIGQPVSLAGSWKVGWPSFSATMDRLRSWTEYPEVRFFSGKAGYETVVEVPRDRFKPGTRFVLDLGEVRELADVRINGVPAGVAWKMPYRLDVTGRLKPGRNAIRIDVSNLLINHVLSLPVRDYSDVEARYPIGTRVPRGREKELQKVPLPSGLLGPVVIRTLEP